MQHVALVDILVYLPSYMYQQFGFHLRHRLLCDSLIRSSRSRCITNTLFIFRSIRTFTDGLCI